MAAKAGFSISDLQQGAKSLASVDQKSSQHVPVDDSEALRSLEDVYTKHEGDLDAIFDELKADPTKAKKPHNRPSNAKEFASKYLQGFYNIIDDHADSKSSRK